MAPILPPRDPPPRRAGGGKPREGEAAEPVADGLRPTGRDELPVVRDRERIRAGVRAALFGETVAIEHDRPAVAFEFPAKIGRFEVGARLGSGGMGVVCRGFDPELDRAVAIKLVRPELFGSSDAEAAAQRLLREAQAMARLNHPNVITVHEVGTVPTPAGDLVFIAMELVDGCTLGEWLATPRSPRAIIDRFLLAGEGLAAAHQAGLVHRDFKPDNVLLGDDGRVRVVDFGLARAAGVDEIAPSVRSVEPRTPLQTPLTHTGAVMGTPAYMSPEQHDGRPADARSDQFSVCVALWEALFGERPFAGDNYAELAAAVRAGRRRTPRAGRGVAHRIVAVLERGLAVDPADRFPSMRGLLEALRADPWRRRRRVGLGLTVALVASGSTWAVLRASNQTAAACDALDQALVGTWDADARTRVKRAFLATGAPFAEPVHRSSERLLDAYADSWIRAARETCAAGQLGSVDEDLLERRQACVDTRRAELEQLVVLLAGADEAIASQAVDAAATLNDPGSCADPRRLAAWSAPTDPVAQRDLAAARTSLGLAKAEGHLGEHDAAIQTAQAAIDEAHRLDDPATEAAGLLVRGHEEARSGSEAAELTLRRAVERAEVARAHVTRAEALIRLIDVVSRDRTRYAEAKALGSEARAVLNVIGVDPLIGAKLDNNLGVAALRAGDDVVALEHFRRSLAADVEALGEAHPETARAYANIGLALGSQGKLSEAEPYLRTALSRFEEVLGPDHAMVGAALGTLAVNLARRDRHAEAIDLFERSLTIKRRSTPEDARRIARAEYNLGTALYQAQRYDVARGHLRAGLQLREAASDVSPGELRSWSYTLGGVEYQLGNYDAAQRLQERAVALGAAAEASPQQQAAEKFALAMTLAVGDGAVARRLLVEIRPEVTEDSALAAAIDGWLGIDDSVERLRSLARRR